MEDPERDEVEAYIKRNISSLEYGLVLHIRRCDMCRKSIINQDERWKFYGCYADELTKKWRW